MLTIMLGDGKKMSVFYITIRGFIALICNFWIIDMKHLIPVVFTTVK